jgi:hypothetical protein
MKILSDPIVYYEIRLPGRANVREPIPRPEMVLLRENSADACIIPLNEAQLLAIAKDVTETLDRMRLGRNATVAV